ncbi:DUF3237 domain-containing protein [Roseiarcaceae bacterium H3SJ34-1]|uniref:DUF3237 domain-containing protein n=1 Tax=Terripilifer ovatus TaxID=3032367 RepID=UPI003AB9937C|nr:DUF3237 domain-containing protein [Roseiarcaceae bacterium H3SJ34-1]
MPIAIAFEHICDLSVEVARPLEIGETGLGERRVIDITGGTVSGPKFNGRIRPGADFQIIRPNGLTVLHARYVIEADDGALVYVENDGIRFGPREALDRLKRGEPVDPALIYFRSVPRFETGSDKYRWLMQSIFVCSGVRTPGTVELSVYRLA